MRGREPSGNEEETLARWRAKGDVGDPREIWESQGAIWTERESQRQ